MVVLERQEGRKVCVYANLRDLDFLFSVPKLDIAKVSLLVQQQDKATDNLGNALSRGIDNQLDVLGSLVGIIHAGKASERCISSKIDIMLTLFLSAGYRMEAMGKQWGSKETNRRKVSHSVLYEYQGPLKRRCVKVEWLACRHFCLIYYLLRRGRKISCTWLSYDYIRALLSTFGSSAGGLGWGQE